MTHMAVTCSGGEVAVVWASKAPLPGWGVAKWMVGDHIQEFCEEGGDIPQELARMA